MTALPPGVKAPLNAAMVRAVGMRLGDLFRDPHDGMTSVVKTSAMVALVALVAAFAVQAWTRTLDWMDYIGFALSVTIVSGAPIASSAVNSMAPRLAGLTGKYGQAPAGPNGGAAVAATPPETAAVQPPKA